MSNDKSIPVLAMFDAVIDVAKRKGAIMCPLGHEAEALRKALAVYASQCVWSNQIPPRMIDETVVDYRARIKQLITPAPPVVEDTHAVYRFKIGEQSDDDRKNRRVNVTVEVDPPRYTVADFTNDLETMFGDVLKNVGGPADVTQYVTVRIDKDKTPASTWQSIINGEVSGMEVIDGNKQR